MYTFEGHQYECMRDLLLPYMNVRVEEGGTVFVAYTGGFIRDCV